MESSPAPLPLTEHFTNLVSWLQSLITGQLSPGQIWQDIYRSPFFNHPPYMLAFLLCTLLPLLFLIDNIGKAVPAEKANWRPKKETKKTQ